MKKIITALALALGALGASALPLIEPVDFKLTSFVYTPTIGGVVGSPITGVGHIGALNAGTDTTAYDPIFGGTDTFIAYCIELTENTGGFNVLRPYVKSTYFAGTEPSGSMIDGISKLFTFNNGLTTTDKISSAAMQLAIWEIVYDAAPGDLTSGSFHIFGSSPHLASAAAQANVLLAGAASSFPLFDVTTYTNKGFQDFVSGGQSFGCNELDCGGGGNVPEPGSLPLMLGSLGALGFLSRKKIQK